MEIFKKADVLRAYVERQKEMGKKIGFVPTMGALHEGHLSLLELAKHENNLVICSIYVNPTQFNNKTDLEKYPRDLKKDEKYLESSELVDVLYAPNTEDIYPEGVASRSYEFDGLEDEMEGKFRPGHFNGVATVVENLLQQVKPDNAYFGEKDYQQLKIIKKFVEKKKLPINIVGVSIYREKNGLAASSRNERLTKQEREDAKLIHDTLIKVNDWFRVLTIPEIKKRVDEIFNNQKELTLEYFIIADEDTLKETDFFYTGHQYRAFIAANTKSNVRLIDNMHLD